MLEVVQNVIASNLYLCGSYLSALINKYGSANAAGIFDWVCLIVFSLSVFIYSLIFFMIGIRKGKKLSMKQMKKAEEDIARVSAVQ